MIGRKKSERYFICPNCGAVIPEKSRACPECGADEETGWADELYPENNSFPEENEKSFHRDALLKKATQYGSMVIAVILVYGLIAWFLPFGQYIGILVSGGLLTGILSMGRFLKKKDKDGALLERELLIMAGHDPERVERLVMHEWKKNPAANRMEMVQAAIDRLKRDRL